MIFPHYMACISKNAHILGAGKRILDMHLNVFPPYSSLFQTKIWLLGDHFDQKRSSNGPNGLLTPACPPLMSTSSRKDCTTANGSRTANQTCNSQMQRMYSILSTRRPVSMKRFAGIFLSSWHRLIGIWPVRPSWIQDPIWESRWWGPGAILYGVGIGRHGMAAWACKRQDPQGRMAVVCREEV